MRIIVEWMNLGTTTRLLALLIIGIAHVSVAQVVSKSNADAPLPTNTKAGQHLSPAAVRMPKICVQQSRQPIGWRMDLVQSHYPGTQAFPRPHQMLTQSLVT